MLFLLLKFIPLFCTCEFFRLSLHYCPPLLYFLHLFLPSFSFFLLSVSTQAQFNSRLANKTQIVTRVPLAHGLIMAVCVCSEHFATCNQGF